MPTMRREDWGLRMPQPRPSPCTHLVHYRLRGGCCPASWAIWVPSRQPREAAALPTMCRGLCQLPGCHAVPGRGSPHTEGSGAGLSDVLYAGRLPEHAGLLSLPPGCGQELSAGQSTEVKGRRGRRFMAALCLPRCRCRPLGHVPAKHRPQQPPAGGQSDH